MLRTTHMQTAPFPNVNAPDQFTANELNNVYEYGQFWIPAGALTPGVTAGCTVEPYESSSANPATWTVAKFDTAVDQDAHFTWGFKSDFVNVATPRIKLSPIWFVKTLGVDPNDLVRFGANVYNNVIAGGSLNYNNVANEVYMEQDTIATYEINGGNAGSTPQAALFITTIGNDALSASDWNMLTMTLTRTGTHVNDNYPASVFLLGVGVQFHTDFGNIAIWPN